MADLWDFLTQPCSGKTFVITFLVTFMVVGQVLNIRRKRGRRQD